MIYLCNRCGSQVTKEPLLARDDYKSASVTEFGGLGKWKCICGNNKVKAVPGQSGTHQKTKAKNKSKSGKRRKHGRFNNGAKTSSQQGTRSRSGKSPSSSVVAVETESASVRSNNEPDGEHA